MHWEIFCVCSGPHGRAAATKSRSLLFFTLLFLVCTTNLRYLCKQTYMKWDYPL